MSEEINEVNEVKENESGEKKPNKCTIELSKLTSCITVVVYIDQVGYRKQNLDISTSTSILEDAIKRMCEVPGYKVVGVVHNKDKHSDGLDDVDDKVHAHIMIMPQVKCRCTKILRDFSFILQYDVELDANLIDHELKYLNIQKNHHKINYVYFAHDTVGAINDGKIFYGYDSIITNVSEEETQDWRTWYEQHERGVEYHKGHKNSKERVQLLMRDYYNYGLNGDSFKVHRNELVFEDLCNKTLMEELERIYTIGLEQYLSKRQVLSRCSVYIYSDAQVGKSTNCYNVLEQMGERPLVVTKNSKTGALDNLDCKQSLIYDDRWPESCLDMADDFAVNVWRRNSNNRCFNGNYFVILSNQTFEEFFKEMNVDQKALYSRFFIVHISKDNIDGETYTYILEHSSDRGDHSKKEEMFYTFMDSVMKEINIYHNNYYIVNGERRYL